MTDQWIDMVDDPNNMIYQQRSAVEIEKVKRQHAKVPASLYRAKIKVDLAPRLTKYYYIRDSKNRPVVTVCLLVRDGSVARGVAICNDQDAPCKRIGRNLARGRAVAALLNEKTTLPINRNIVLDKLNSHTTKYKSVHAPSLTSFEMKLLKNTINSHSSKSSPSTEQCHGSTDRVQAMDLLTEEVTLKQPGMSA